MKHVYIAQLKCPMNHCVMGLYGEYESAEDAEALAGELRQTFDELVAAGVIIYECAICKSKLLNVHVDRTRFRTMEEARPAMEQCEADQIATQQFLRGGRN